MDALEILRKERKVALWYFLLMVLVALSLLLFGLARAGAGSVSGAQQETDMKHFIFPIDSGKRP